jgi:hypothetical protein
MAFEQNNMSGALFRNDKDGNDARPDYKGSITIDGKKYWLSGWKKKSEMGKSYMSLAAQPNVPPDTKPAKKKKPTNQDLEDDEIPY